MLHPLSAASSRPSVSSETLHWKELNLDELGQVLKSEDVTGEQADYEYIRRDGALHLFNDECSIELMLNNEQAA